MYLLNYDYYLFYFIFDFFLRNYIYIYICLIDFCFFFLKSIFSFFKKVKFCRLKYILMIFCFEMFWFYWKNEFTDGYWTLWWQFAPLSCRMGDTLCVSLRQTARWITTKVSKLWGAFEEYTPWRLMVVRLGAGASWRSIWCQQGGSSWRPCHNLREGCSGGVRAATFTCNELDQQMPVRMRRGIVTSIRQTRDRQETAQSVAAVDDMSGEEESGDILGRPHSSVQSSLKRLHVNLGHPKNNVYYVISGTHTRCNEPWKLHESSNALLAKPPNIPVWHDNLPQLKSSLL